MRSVQLAQVAARSEGLRLRLFASRTATRLALGLVAFIFLIAAIVDGHIALGLWLTPLVGPINAVGLIAAGDVVITLIVGLIAGLKGPGRLEREALELRERARVQALEALTFTAAVGSATRAIGVRRIAAMLGYAGRALGGRR